MNRAATSTPAPPTPAMRRAVLMLAAGETLVWAALFYSFAALLFTWETTLNWPKSELALGLTISVLVAATVSPIAGRFVDAGKGPWLLGGGALIGALALVLLSRVQTSQGFVVVWGFIGIAQGTCLYEPCFSLLTRTTGAFARGAITRVTLAAGFASTLAFPAAAFLAGHYGWRDTLLIFAAVTCFVAAPLLFIGATKLGSVEIHRLFNNAAQA